MGGVLLSDRDAAALRAMLRDYKAGFPSLRGSLQRRRGMPPLAVETPQVHIAYVKTAPGAATTVTCYLDTDGTGEEITVNCCICGGSALNSAIGRLEDGKPLFVVYITALEAWWCIGSPFQATTDCT